jgi:glycosidase
MKHWPQNPTIYEINTWVWLEELSRRYRREVTLETLPASEWDAIGALGVDAVWLMGVWERSPAGTHIARTLGGLQDEYRRALPDFTASDVVGSPYCVHRYVVDERLGGPEGLASAREHLAKRNMKLLLDFVPNHVALDHPWVARHPDYLVQGNAEQGEATPGHFHAYAGLLLAHGRDPYFPPWTDTLQVNAFHPGLRAAVVETLRNIASQCDGVRCDMAMLVTNRVFGETWGPWVGPAPSEEFWTEVTRTIHRRFPDFLFIAESYWDLEWELQQQGFDYCYDKRLYDRLVHAPATSVRDHVRADLGYQKRLVRFIENHDEPRAAAVFGAERSQAAAVVMATLPGAKLFHQGQFEGCRIKLPVQLGRRPAEVIDAHLHGFYRTLLRAIKRKVLRDGDWMPCETNGWPDNQSHYNLAAWCWRKGKERLLIVVNLSSDPAQGRVRVPWDQLTKRSWRLTDVFSGQIYERAGDEMLDPGLYIELGGWGFHFLRFA